MDGKYENIVIEYKKWRSLINKVVNKNITVLSNTELYVGLF